MSNSTIVHPSFDDPTAFVFYRYAPSKAAAVIFALAFACTTIFHLYQMIAKKSWYFTPFIIGGCLETLGYVGRIVSAGDQWVLGPYLMQTLCLLVAPSLLAASIYMVLGRIIILVQGERYSMIKKKWLTKIFVCGDVLSFFLQAGGGGMMAGGALNMLHLGENIVVVGLFVQLTFFSFFLVTATRFHIRFKKSASPMTLPPLIAQSWEEYMNMLYITSALIMVRSVFRVIEYLQGNAGSLLRHEAYVYIFDGCLMLAAMLLFNLRHPGDFTKLGMMAGEEEMDRLKPGQSQRGWSRVIN